MIGRGPDPIDPTLMSVPAETIHMADANEVTMDKEELDAFLGRGGTGVIAFATDDGDPPYALPVSYGYDEGHGGFYFRLAVTAGSQKAPVLDRPVTFVAFEDTDDGWRSAIATGELQEVTDAEHESSALQAMWAVEIPMVEVFERPTREIDFRYFRLVPDHLTGRRETRRQP